MGYALFAQRKLVLDGQLNSLSLQQTQRSDEQMRIATHTLGLQQQMASMQASQSTELAAKYRELAAVGDGEEVIDEAAAERLERDRASINEEITALENEFQAELDGIQRKIYISSVKENTVEMQVKRLDTMVAAVEKELEAVEKAENDAIDRATPNYSAQG